ncbi:type II secretion system protein J [Chloroflexota bacterium]
MKGQKGLSLVELLIAMAITGIITAFLGTAIYQIITVTEYGNDKLTATHELQNAAYWMNLDGQSASTASGGSELELTLPDGMSITYSLVGTELRRTVGGATITLAQNISSLIFSVEGSVLTMEITSAPQGRDQVNEQGTYKVYLRPTVN